MNSQAFTFPECSLACPLVVELDEKVGKLEGENEELRQLVHELKNANEKLKKELAESKRPDYVKPKRKQENPKKPGRKKGHRGESRRVPDHVDEVVEVRPLVECPDCGHKVSDPVEWRDRYVEEIVLPKVHVTKLKIPRSYCSRCDKIVEPTVRDVMPKRQLGNKLRSYVVYLREELRLPVNMVQKHLGDFGIKVSEGTVENVCSEAAEILGPHYQALKEELRESKATNNDETGKRIEGKTCWEWVFAKPDTVIFHSDERRSHKVMEEFYGKHPKPVLGSDCYTAYNPLDAVKQRCWAHLLDDSSELESEEGRALHEKLKSLYSLGKIMDKGPPSTREVKAQYCEDRLRDLVNRNWSDPGARRVVKLLKKHMGEWFNFVRYPEVEPTNNLAERVLRPEVVFRKIIGGHRAWNGARKHDILRSTLATCRLRGENFMDFLEEQYWKSTTSQT